MPSRYIINIHKMHVGSDETGWLILVDRENASEFNTLDEAHMVAKNFSREPCWEIEGIED